MGGFSLWHWLIVGIVVLLLFGRGRFSDMMNDVAKGIKSFKKGLAEDDDAPTHRAPPPARLEANPPAERPVEPSPTPVAEDRRQG